MRITAIEVVRRLPTARAVFPFAKIVNVVDGVCEIRTKERSVLLSAGSAVAVGAGRWCQLVPKPEVRAWTVYADDALWRRQMECSLPIKQRLVPGLHPDDWDGTPLVLHVGEERLLAALRLHSRHESRRCARTGHLPQRGRVVRHATRRPAPDPLTPSTSHGA